MGDLKMASKPRRAKVNAQLAAATGMMLLALIHLFSKTVQYRIYWAIGGFVVFVICFGLVVSWIVSVKKKLASRQADE